MADRLLLARTLFWAMGVVSLTASGGAFAIDLDVTSTSAVSVDDDAPVRFAKRAKKKKPSTPKAEPAADPTTTSSPPPAAVPVDPEDDEGVAPGDMRRNGPSRIEFDDRLIQGQTNKANAIYLFERRASELRTLVRTRKNFHKEIDESLN